jgi:hypothetical protein
VKVRLPDFKSSFFVLFAPFRSLPRRRLGGGGAIPFGFALSLPEIFLIRSARGRAGARRYRYGKGSC